MMDNTNPLDIIKRLDIRHNVTIRVLDEVTGMVIQEHEGHNAATNSLLTGIAHYLMGDGVLSQGSDMLSTWVPQYISVGTMGLTNQNSETIIDGDDTIIVPSGIGYTPEAPIDATDEEKELNAVLRFSEYVNQAPGFGADGYDFNTNNNREWFGLGYPYSEKPDAITQDFFDGDGDTDTFELSTTPINIISVTIYPDGVVDESRDANVTKTTLSVDDYELENNMVVISNPNVIPPAGSRLAVIYTQESKDAANCELITANTLRSAITYRNIIPEVQSEIPNTLDVIYSAFVSTGALAQFRGDNDYIYITEVGLWSKSAYNNSGDNGLLAGYRIMPTDDEANEIGVQETFTGDGTTKEFAFTNKAVSVSSVTIDNVIITEFDFRQKTNTLVFDDAPENGANIIVNYSITNSWKDMSVEENRLAVQKNIIRVGKNQVAQIIWKLQLGGLEQLNGLRYIYPPQYPEEVWNVWTST